MRQDLQKAQHIRFVLLKEQNARPRSRNPTNGHFSSASPSQRRGPLVKILDLIHFKLASNFHCGSLST
jgi:hypothetical protein